MRRRRSTAHQAVRPPDTGLLMRARRVADIKRRVQAGTYLVSLNRLAALLHAALARP
jgi:anti-sigma28 factor (negative regulator of flagellin synthesis)